MAKGQPRAHDLTGITFGRLNVTSLHEKRGRNRIYWFCSCACGATKWVIADALKAGSTRSCGCLNDQTRRTIRKPGAMIDGKHSPEYTSWHSMKQRCTNPNNKKYLRYGGRGITFCERWMDFANFLSDMGQRPSLKHTLERKENSGNYHPKNCVWATKAEQNRNHSRNRFITFRGETLCIADWIKRTGITHTTLHYRLKHWTIEKALTEPVRT